MHIVTAVVLVLVVCVFLSVVVCLRDELSGPSGRSMRLGQPGFESDPRKPCSDIPKASLLLVVYN